MTNLGRKVEGQSRGRKQTYLHTCLPAYDVVLRIDLQTPSQAFENTFSKLAQRAGALMMTVAGCASTERGAAVGAERAP